MVFLKLLDQLRDSVPGSYCKGPHIVRAAHPFRCHLIRQLLVGLPSSFLRLLPQSVKSRQDGISFLIFIDFNIITYCICRKESDNAICREEILLDNTVKQRICFIKQLLCLPACVFILQHIRKLTLHLPGNKKRPPVDIPAQFPKVELFEKRNTRFYRGCDGSLLPIDYRPVLPGLLQTQVRFPFVPLAVLYT